MSELVACQRIVNQLQLQFNALGLTTEIEDEMVDQKRCDITIQHNIGGRIRLLVVEVKGQWHKDIFTAAGEQLEERYMGHPNAEDQGVYLALWYGPDVLVANVKNTALKSALDLKQSIESYISDALLKRIDVVVLDLSKSKSRRIKDSKKKASKKKASKKKR